MSIHRYLEPILALRDLEAAEAREAMRLILGGAVPTAQLTAFLIALRMKGETAGELFGFASAMREHAVAIDPGPGEHLVDTCGTGGDGGRTFNISTIAAFVAAGAGARVAKHGNRSFSSQCGSADLLEALGVELALEPEQMGQAIRETGIGFLFAPRLHPAIKHAQPARLELKTRTVFNLLGPLTNPAGARAQLIGAFSETVAERMAGALALLGADRAFVVHAGGLDEISTLGPTVVFEVAGGEVRRTLLHPEDFGMAPARPADLAGGDKEANRAIALAILEGEPGPRRDIVVVNAAAALVAAGVAADFREGVERARAALDSGAAHRKLEQLAAFSERYRPRPA